ncbi:MAG: hypothetical protein IPG50_06220 [Myxococcales bacterium]|nr:hypothetical protein [Myxococcales bacterium]
MNSSKYFVRSPSTVSEQIDPRRVELVLRHRRVGQHQEPVGVDAPGA